MPVSLKAKSAAAIKPAPGLNIRLPRRNSSHVPQQVERKLRAHQNDLRIAREEQSRDLHPDQEGHVVSGHAGEGRRRPGTRRLQARFVRAQSRARSRLPRTSSWEAYSLTIALMSRMARSSMRLRRRALCSDMLAAFTIYCSGIITMARARQPAAAQSKQDNRFKHFLPPRTPRTQSLGSFDDFSP